MRVVTRLAVVAALAGALVAPVASGAAEPSPTPAPVGPEPGTSDVPRMADAARDGGLLAAAAEPTVTTTAIGGTSLVGEDVLGRARDVGGHADRIAGADRYRTAVAVAQRVAPVGADEVVLASGETFPDALAAGPLATRLKGPVLLTAKGALPAVVANELRRLGPRRVTVVGGEGAVSPDAVASARAAAGGGAVAVRRVGGADRYATAAAVAALMPSVSGAVLTSGVDFPDALTAAPLAARLSGPLLLVRPDRLPDPTADELRRLQPDRLVVVGGGSSVSYFTARSAGSAAGVSPERAAGADRYLTSSAVAALVVAGGQAEGAYLATGTDYPDALVGGVAAAARKGPVLLTGRQRGHLGAVAADVGKVRGVGSWLQLSLDAVATQQRLPESTYVAYEAAYRATSLAILHGWDDAETQAQLARMRAVRKPDGGYGMERAWDAFQDGSVNPRETSYLITTVDHAGLALVVGLRAGAVPASEVTALVDLVLRWPSIDGDPGCLAYSTSPTDRRYCVYNVNSAAAWFLKAAWDAGVRRPGQLELAERLYTHDVAFQRDGWWPYSSTRTTAKQDWNHNAAMVEFQLLLDPPAGQATLDLVMPGGWDHPDPAAVHENDVIGYVRLLPFACGYRSPALAPARARFDDFLVASDAGQAALWAVRTVASCGE
ncbi:cell wall-binding repeat-containing protein [Oryzobacter sp. R7]|uniref:cell wall-binding repeat-containing protein n=1 Tax=Oryzobacter faecalis TaxID=3388656 RepID=UPI00398D0991